jgi:predicted O-methyltransferase YrrM
MAGGGRVKRIQMTGQPGAILGQMLAADPWLFYPLRNAKNIPATVGQHQGAALAVLARQFNRAGAHICNIGTSFGYSTALLAEGAPNAKIVTLEPKGPKIEAAQQWLGPYKNVELVPMKSWDYLAENPDVAWDLVFIDGCHVEILRDMPWFNRVKVGGLFMSHDYIPDRFPMVVEALNGLREHLKRPFDVSMICSRNRGMVGFYRRRGEYYEQD